jgi:hypothetical protein
MIFTCVAFLFIPILSGGQSGTQIYSLKAQNYEIEKIRGDFDKITLDGFFSYPIPGYPDLPAKIYYIAVPPDVDEQSIEVDCSLKGVVHLGYYRIREVPPLFTWKDDQRIAGAKADIYPRNDFFPEKIVEYLGLSQMRKWRLAVLRYTPFQYNPATGHLLHIPEVEVRIAYDRKGAAAVSSGTLADSVMDERAREIVMNYSESQDWYRPRADVLLSATKYDYVIFTTSTIKYGYSHYLSGDFVTHLRNKGYNPLIVTEIEFGGLTGQYPNGPADKIRKWLQNHYLSYGIKYVLLIGNPDPDDPEQAADSVGDIPMKYLSGRGSDYYYADLTGNWDLDGDGIFGEYDGDRGFGGVDFVNECYVGRIPYYSAADDLASVLTKIISYGSTTDISWRRSALLPTSFIDPETDRSYWAKAMISGYLNTAAFSNWKMYMQGSACAAADSPFASDEELRGGKTVLRWSIDDFGMVWWAGHGNEIGAYIGWEGCWDGAIIESPDVTSLDDSHPSFVFQSSCGTGQTEISNNLGKSLLYGGAIATVCTNYTSWGVGEWSPSSKFWCDDCSIGYFYGLELVANNKTAGKALFDVKSEMGVNGGWWGMDSWKNLCGYNLYGDPSVSILENGLGPALDNNTLQFYTIGDGTALWYIQSETYYYDGDAAQSGDINDGETVAIYSKVRGPGVLKFYWKVSSEQNFDFLCFYVDGYLKDRISGEYGWEQKAYKISPGVHSVSWRYEKDSSKSQGSDCGWVDKVEYESPGAGQFLHSGSWTGAGHGTDGWYVGDFNGDNRDDIFRYMPGVSGAQVFLSNGSKFVPAGSWTGAGHGTDGWYVGDFNGDNRDDIFRYMPGVSGAQVFLSDGTKFVPAGSWTGAGHGADGWYVGDFNGDRRDDIFRRIPGVSGAQVFLSDGTKFVYSGSWTGTEPGTENWYLGDFDGNGMDDIFRYVPGVSGAQVFLSDGTRFGSSGSWTGAGHGTDGWYVGDFNGDGWDDIFRYMPGVSGAQVFLADGTKFIYSGSWTGAGHGTDGWYVGDFNGDGACDIFRYLPGISGADVFLGIWPVGSAAAMEPPGTTELDADMMLDLNGARQTELSFGEEAALLAPFTARVMMGEEISIYEIKTAYEQRVERVVRLVQIRQMLQRHGYWDIEGQVCRVKQGTDKIDNTK